MKQGDWITVFPTSNQSFPKNHLTTSITMLEQSEVVYLAVTRCGRVFYYPSELVKDKKRGKEFPLYPDCKVCTMASKADARKAS